MSDDGAWSRRMLAITPAAIGVGVGCSFLLGAVLKLANSLEHGVWVALPEAAGFPPDSWWWILGVLTATGLAVGLVVAYLPGHAGPDPATEGLVAPPHAVSVVPGLLIAVTLALAGGVSLGPENPIIASSVALACALGVAWRGPATTPLWVGLASAGTIGAMFGTPVAAALVLSEMPGTDPREPLWDRLFAPLVAAGAGAVTTQLLGQPVFAVAVPRYPGLRLIDVVSGSVIAVAACALGLGIVALFPVAHAMFCRFRHPVIMLTCGGLVLGLLGVIGGRITLFKGLHEMQELTADVAAYSTLGLVLIIAVKAGALLVAASSGFRGGRIFPTVFIGVAIGLLASRIAPGVPTGVAIGSAVLGIVLAITHQGWLSLLMAAAVVADTTLLPILAIAVLPAWLFVRSRHGMVIEEPAPPRPTPA
ncbi:ion channel protein [Luedemannella helvata]|uniref:Ion channel protein n=1 Tax=Luedemannella helvata TaxID=349315 RepID=A0ABN2K0C8_9ACTN